MGPFWQTELFVLSRHDLLIVYKFAIKGIQVNTKKNYKKLILDVGKIKKKTNNDQKYLVKY